MKILYWILATALKTNGIKEGPRLRFNVSMLMSFCLGGGLITIWFALWVNKLANWSEKLIIHVFDNEKWNIGMSLVIWIYVPISILFYLNLGNETKNNMLIDQYYKKKYVPLYFIVVIGLMISPVIYLFTVI
jgi:Na+/H+ antiporter NhaA